MIWKTYFSLKLTVPDNIVNKTSPIIIILIRENEKET